MDDVSDGTMAPKVLEHATAAAAREPVLVAPAPEPDLPQPRDRAGAQLGMMILLVGGGLFWAGIAALFIYLLR